MRDLDTTTHPAVSGGSATETQVPAGPQTMTPSEAFVETMAANGVTDMFGIMGSAFMDAWTSSPRQASA